MESNDEAGWWACLWLRIKMASLVLVRGLLSRLMRIFRWCSMCLRRWCIACSLHRRIVISKMCSPALVEAST